MTRLFTIKEVAARTGMSTQLIRKWEERYEAVMPSRFPNGYRGYSQFDVDKLIGLKNKVEQGVPIGLAVQEQKNDATFNREVYSLFDQPHIALSYNELKEYQDQLIACFIQTDQIGAQRVFDQLTVALPMDYVMLQVLQPVLVELGELWEQGRISEYQEHFGSHFIRDKLMSVNNVSATSSASPLLVTACAPHERHELGILFLGYFAKQQGFQIAYLGTSPAEKGIMDCMEHMRPSCFAFSTSTQALFERSAAFYSQLDRRIVELGLSTKVFIGGRIIDTDALLPGTHATYTLTGNAQQAVMKMKRLLVL